MNVVSPYIYINLTTATCCLFFLLFLLLTYFSKKNMNNIDNLIYKYMLVFNLLSSIFYILFYAFDLVAIFSTNQDFYYKIVYFFSKLAPLMIMYWVMFFCFYTFIMTHEKDKKFMNNFASNRKKIFKFIYLIMIIVGIIHCLEKSEVNLATGMEYHLLIVMNVTLYLVLIISIVNIVKNRKNIEKKKLLPIFAILPIIVTSALFGALDITIVFLLIMITSMNHLMYHTIENPDMKLINELELAKNLAEKASQAKSDFLSSMSHELRTPLNAIVGLTQMLEMTDDWNEVREDAKDIKKSSTNLLELVDTILSVNSIDNGNVEIKNGNYNPYELFDHIVKVNENRIGNKEIQFKVDISNDLPNTLYGDKDKVKTIIDNLLSNAIKYTDAGYVELVVNCFVVKDKCNLRISVSDTGKGIKDEELEHLFDKFYRSQENIDSDISGTGLGLSITKSLVDLFEGKINVNSTYGEGTTFFVTLSQGIVNNSVEPVESKNTSITNEVVDNNENNTEIL